LEKKGRPGANDSDRTALSMNSLGLVKLYRETQQKAKAENVGEEEDQGSHVKVRHAGAPMTLTSVKRKQKWAANESNRNASGKKDIRPLTNTTEERNSFDLDPN